MSEPPTGPQGNPPAAPGQPPSGGTPYPPQQPGPQNDAQQTVPQQTVPQQPVAQQPVPQQAVPQQPGPQYGAGQPAPQQPGPYGSATPEPPTVPYSAPPAPAGYAVPASVPPYGGPISGPPVAGVEHPMSAPPVSGPAYAQPMSAPPVSGPAYGQPMSAPPGFVPPYGPAAPVARKGRAVLILALVAGLLFVLGGVMTGLYVTKGNELDRTERRLTGQVSERDGTIAANAKEIEKLKTDLQGVQDKLADTEQDLTGTRNDRDEQARQKKVIADCLDKLTTALGAASVGNKAEYDKAMKGLDKVCDEAENYL
ncbi:hypothetical protein [Micromonospora sp. WMMD812]|uniref:hypothetical protein n=1 Tax=Micromonospora sp. WMMD812 TaxID=3015152 RepID=UPI00248BAA78|nr:hypothetical protein [Micromonospora sp. WMMD812]WBB70240.1 hypothetical protein O7603_13135 [Micromonospora sp. WMMD812]